MKKYYEKMVFSLIVLSLTLLVACGSPYSKYSGAWYSSNEPDRKELILTDDGVFSIGDESGSFSVQDDTLILVGASSENMYITKDENGDKCLVDSSGYYWYNSYDTAINRHSEIIKKEIEKKKRSIIGKWIGDYNALDLDDPPIYMNIKDDGTYEIIDNESNFYESGTWDTYVDADDEDCLLMSVKVKKFEPGSTDIRKSMIGNKTYVDTGRIMSCEIDNDYGWDMDIDFDKAE